MGLDYIVSRLTDTRIEERPYKRSRWIREWHCAWSSVPFVCIAWARLYFDALVTGRVRVLYHLLWWIGSCSFAHHATRPNRVTVPMDWIPITGTLLCVIHWDVVFAVKPVTAAMCIAAFLWLLWDQIRAPIPSPWGHVIWHITAALTLDALYQNYAVSMQ